MAIVLYGNPSAFCFTADALLYSSLSSQDSNAGMQFPPLDTVATFYFFMGLFSSFLCIGIAFKPSFFRAKGAVIGLPYPVWSIEHEIESQHTGVAIESTV